MNIADRPTGGLDMFVYLINTLRPRQNGHEFADAIFKFVSEMEIFKLRLNITEVCSQGLVDNIPELV